MNLSVHTALIYSNDLRLWPIGMLLIIAHLYLTTKVFLDILSVITFRIRFSESLAPICAEKFFDCENEKRAV